MHVEGLKGTGNYCIASHGLMLNCCSLAGGSYGTRGVRYTTTDHRWQYTRKLLRFLLCSGHWLGDRE